MYGVVIEKGPQNWQILQQNNGKAVAELSGRVEVEDEVLSFNDKRVIVRIIDGNTGSRITELKSAELCGEKWKAAVDIPVGGPYTIETYLRYNVNCEKKGDRIFNIGVGDVYLITGQSNAVGVGKDAVNDPPSADVHMFRLSGKWDIATHPLHDTTDTRFPLSEERVRCGHSPWINFAKILSDKLGYPIGLIPGTKGGIPLSCWDRAEDGKFFDNALSIVRASGGGIKGILWSQGCNDTWSVEMRSTYLERFKRVCADFRKEFYEDIPIITVQLNKTTCTKNNNLQEVGYNWSVIRDAQRRAAKEIDGVYIIPSIDLPVCDGIHNSCMSNMVIGERAANIALKYIYSKQIICDEPEIEKAVLGGNKVTLYFNNVYDMINADLNCTDKLMFSVTDSKGRITPIDYSCPGDNSIELIFDRDIDVQAVVNCDGYNDSGLIPYDLYTRLPILPFNGIKVKNS